MSLFTGYFGLYQPYGASSYFQNAFGLGYTEINTVIFYFTLPL